MATVTEPTCPRCGELMIKGWDHVNCRQRPTTAEHDALLDEVRELRQELAAMTTDRDKESAVGDDWFRRYNELSDEHERLRQELAEAKWCKPGCESRMVVESELIALRQRAEQAEAQMAMLVGKLIDVATGYRRDAAEEGCDAGNFDGGSTDTCAHCQLLQQAEGIDSLLATLPASANQMLEREQAMRVALANAIEAAVEQKMHTGMVCVASCDTDGECCRQVSNLMASERCYQRARDALRKEVKQGDKTGL